ncbi:MAG: hypothetical protein LC808_09745 [Actinobacteria bacterium]|nr:hypothetical protein [Actinomycetota bacterium]
MDKLAGSAVAVGMFVTLCLSTCGSASAGRILSAEGAPSSSLAEGSRGGGGAAHDPALTVYKSSTPAERRERHRGRPGRSGTHVDMGRWAIAVSLSASRMGPLAITTTAVRRAPEMSSRPWIEHDIRIENVSSRRILLGDTRTSAYARSPHDRSLVGADEGCGYGLASGSDEIDVGVCAAYLDAPTLDVERIERTVTLFKGLLGMEPLQPGTYVFHKRLRFKVGKRAQRTDRLDVVYEIRLA